MRLKWLSFFAEGHQKCIFHPLKALDLGAGQLLKRILKKVWVSPLLKSFIRVLNVSHLESQVHLFSILGQRKCFKKLMSVTSKGKITTAARKNQLSWYSCKAGGADLQIFELGTNIQTCFLLFSKYLPSLFEHILWTKTPPAPGTLTLMPSSRRMDTYKWLVRNWDRTKMYKNTECTLGDEPPSSSIIVVFLVVTITNKLCMSRCLESDWLF